MQLRRYVLMLVFCILSLPGGAAHAADPCADGLLAFQKADLFFSNAERADPNVAQQLWQLGTQLLQAHRDDTPPPGCDTDRFALTRVSAVEHGLAVGYAWAGLSADEAARHASQLFEAAAYDARGKRTLGGVYAAWMADQHDLYQRATEYMTSLYGSANASMIARHKPSGPHCAAPNVEVEPLQVVTPQYPEAAKDANLGLVRAIVTVGVDSAGRVTGTTLKQSSGNKAIDAAAIAAARLSLYLPKIANCVPVAGTYDSTTTFQ